VEGIQAKWVQATLKESGGEWGWLWWSIHGEVVNLAGEEIGEAFFMQVPHANLGETKQTTLDHSCKSRTVPPRYRRYVPDDP